MHADESARTVSAVVPAMVRADVSDADRIVTTLVSAFHDDPVWSWAFPDPRSRPRQYEVIWGLYVRSALSHDWVWMTEGAEAAAVWFPPEADELSPGDEQRLPGLLHELVGHRAPAVLALLERFEDNHPRAEPHFYLDLLGTHPDYRGQGLGMALLRRTLKTVDAEGMPAYLESTNPANNARYASVGFEVVGEFTGFPGGGPITTMWRPARRANGGAEPRGRRPAPATAPPSPRAARPGCS